MKYRSLFYALLFLSNIFFSLDIYSMGAGAFDPQQMQSIQQELEEANKAIEEYVSNLSPEEQADFNRQVDEISQMFENMSEDEFSSFLNEMFGEEPMPEEAMEAFAPNVAVEPIAEAPVLTSEQKKKVENIIRIIDDIIRQTNIFLVQINSSLEASNKIDKWGKAGKVEHWQPGAEWYNFSVDLENFVQKLYKLQDKNLTTHEYKYLSDLIEDEATINNLIQLQTNLNSSVPRIEISEFDIQALSSATKTAIKNTLQHFTEGLYVLALPKALDAIFEKHEPTAKKSREAEEAAEKKAAEALKKPRNPVAATSACTTDEGRYGNDYGYGGYSDYDYGYQPGYSYGDYSPYDSYYGGEGYDGGETGGGGNAGHDGGGGGGEAATPQGGKPSGPRQQTVTKKEVVAGPPAKKDPKIKSLIGDIKDSVKNIVSVVRDNELNKLDDYITGDEEDFPVSSDTANAIVALNKNLDALALDVTQLESFMKKANRNTQVTYNEKFNATMELPLDTLKELSETLDSVKKYYDKSKNKISPEKQWAYFAEKDAVLDKASRGQNDEKPGATEKSGAEERVADLRKNVKARVSLLTLQETLDKFLEAVAHLKKSTAQKAEKKVVFEEVKEKEETKPIEQPPVENLE